MHVVNETEVDVFESQTGEVITELLNSQKDASYSVASITIRPNGFCHKHYHPTAEESYYILSGIGDMIIDGEAKKVSQGDLIHIKPTQVHQIFNHGKIDLKFLAVCSPAFTLDCSVEVE